MSSNGAFICADINGNGKADLKIQVNGGYTFGPTDFLGLGEHVTLTVDGGSTVPVGSAGASAVGFVVGGLLSDNNGSVVFTDGEGHTQTATVHNGTVGASTVNLSGFVDGAIAATLTV
jgi:hypothetical protein